MKFSLVGFDFERRASYPQQEFGNIVSSCSFIIFRAILTFPVLSTKLNLPAIFIILDFALNI